MNYLSIPIVYVHNKWPDQSSTVLITRIHKQDINFDSLLYDNPAWP